MLNINMVFVVLAEIFGVYFVVPIIPIPIPMAFYKVRSKQRLIPWGGTWRQVASIRLWR